jgi:hypothetical protein
MNRLIALTIISVVPIVSNAQVTVTSIQNQLSTPVFITLSTNDMANSRQISSQFSIDADDKVTKEITLQQGESFTVQINNPEASWKKATISFKSFTQTKDNPPSKRTHVMDVELDGTAISPISIVDSPRSNTVKNNRIALHIKKDGITLD